MAALKVPTVTTGKREIDYPESDGKPMAEAERQRAEAAEAEVALLLERLRGGSDRQVPSSAGVTDAGRLSPGGGDGA